MKKTLSVILAALMLLLLAGCAEADKEEPRVEQPLFGTILADDAFLAAKEKMTADSITGLQFYVANATEVFLEDPAEILNIWNLLEKISVGNATEEPQIDDGLVVFDFIFRDGSDYTVSFMTSEYVYGDRSVYEVNNPDSVLAAMNEARNAVKE